MAKGSGTHDELEYCDSIVSRLEIFHRGTGRSQVENSIVQILPHRKVGVHSTLLQVS